MVDISLNVAMGLLAAGIGVTFLRFIKGPSQMDRLLAVETTVLLVLGLVAVFTVKYSQELFVAVLIIAVLGVTSSVAVSKYLTNGRPF